MPSRTLSTIALFILLHTGNAQARFFDTYRADYIKTAFCDAQGAACVSDTDPENSFFQNPAALMAHDSGLVYDGDYDFTGSNSTLEPGQSQRQDTVEKTFLAGFGNAGETWGSAIAVYGRFTSTKTKSSILDANGEPTPSFAIDFNSVDLNARIPFAWRPFPNLSLGLALNFLYHHETIKIDKSSASSMRNIDKLPYPAIAAGAIYGPTRDWRLGVFGQTPTIFYIQQSISVNANGQNLDFTEDMGLNQPWMAGAGASWMPWGDETTFLFDLDIIGTTTDGYQRTVDVIGPAFSDSGLRKKGRDIALEPHIGMALPWWQGSKGTLRLGAYYENGRWQDIKGRVHGTGGLSYDIGLFELIFAADVARDYMSLEFSFR